MIFPEMTVWVGNRDQSFLSEVVQIHIVEKEDEKVCLVHGFTVFVAVYVLKEVFANHSVHRIKF